MVKIKVLDKLTSNQIAAGEVIERPVSVIKELVENSIDAESTRIDIKVREGGLKEIGVTDNGEGMAAEDLPLALARHATSKIERAEDLNRLFTLGFRGEALASIASVSRLTLISRREEDLSGTLLQAEAGDIQKIEDIGSPAGTMVKVNDLFFNTPGRLKFIKSTSREGGRVSNLIYRLAMAYPDISFSLTMEGRKTFSTSGNGNLLGVLAQVYGLNHMDSFIQYRYRGEFFTAEGYLAKPVFCRNNKYHQTFFVNQRYVQNNLLNRAVEEAYYTILPKDRYPVCVINIDMDPAKVDVNVHPTKRQVRFQTENEIFALLKDSIRKTLSDSNLVNRFTFPDILPGSPKDVVQDEIFPFKEINESKKEYNIFSSKQNIAFLSGQEGEKEGKQMPVNKPSPGGVRIIGQFSQSYIIYEDGEANVAFMDQHAAHERILYEQYKEEERAQVQVQQVIPNVIEVDRDLVESFKEQLPSFREAGFHFEEFGRGTFLLRSIPVFIHKIYTFHLIRDMVEEILRDETDQSRAGFKEAIYKVMACKAAVKAGEKLTEGEMETLVQEFQHLQSSSCPHGRPAVMIIPKGEIAKKFLRTS